MKKLRSDSTLAQLTDDQREQLYDWLLSHSYPEVQELAARPESEGGLGVKFNRTTLVRFFDKERDERHAQELAELAAQSDDASTPRKIDLLIRAAKTKFACATYELSKSLANPDNFDRLERALHHIELIQVKREELETHKQELALARERAAEQKRQWEFDAAREVMRNLILYQKIYRQTDIDEHEKVWQARNVAFGEAPSGENSAPPPITGSVPILPDSLRSIGQSPSPESALTQSDTQKHAFTDGQPGDCGYLISRSNQPQEVADSTPFPNQPDHREPENLRSRIPSSQPTHSATIKHDPSGKAESQAPSLCSLPSVPQTLSPESAVKELPAAAPNL